MKRDEVTQTSLLGKAVDMTVPVLELTHEQSGRLLAIPEDQRRAEWPTIQGTIVSVYTLDGAVWYTLQMEDGSLRNVGGSQIRVRT